MRKFGSILTIILCLAHYANVKGQDLDSLRSGFMISPHYGLAGPLSDLSDRFGTLFTIGGSVSYLSKSGLFGSINYSYLFGSQVKEDILSNLRTSEGGIIGRDMQFANVFLRARGSHLYVNAGYLLRFAGEQLRSGILVNGGAGMLTHRIRIVDDFNSIAQIGGDYIKGYDRLSRGLSLQQSISYLHLSGDKLVNFYVKLQLVEGFTRDLRQYNYNRTPVLKNRVDILPSLEIGWIIPIYLRKEQRYY